MCRPEVGRNSDNVKPAKALGCFPSRAIQLRAAAEMRADWRDETAVTASSMVVRALTSIKTVVSPLRMIRSISPVAAL
jgi:hypothetical protein